MNPYGNVKHGYSRTLAYARWKSMIARCTNPNASNYKDYGAKGVSVCSRWRNFPAFFSDMGECPGREYTLDRIDNTFGYQPGNCRWATKTEQNRNRPSHRVELTLNGETRSVTEWAAKLGVNANVIYQRLYLGWSAEEALTTPVKRRPPK